MKKLIGILGILLIPSITSAAAGVGPMQTVTFSFTEADGTSFLLEPLNGTPQTSVIEVLGLRFVTLYVSLIRGGAADDVTVNCNVGYSTTTVSYPLQSVATTAGVATYSDYVPTKAVTGDKKFPVVFDVDGYSHLQCSFDGTNSTAADTLDLVVIGGVK